jgi:hypothetical protein
MSLIQKATALISAPAIYEYLAGAVVVFVLCVLSFCAGYLYRVHLDDVTQAAATATVQTAETAASAAVATADTHIDTTLQKRLNAATSRAAALQRQITDAQHATPAPADCRLSDGLRSALNGDLASGTGQVQNALQ